VKALQSNEARNAAAAIHHLSMPNALKGLIWDDNSPSAYSPKRLLFDISASKQPVRYRPIRDVMFLPVGRIAEPEDAANAVLLFAGGQSDFVTGKTLLVNAAHWML
jgi:NAD(P)-dependent dehydrogenase (short-subunit alcohol dehydrogenase family)